MKPWDRFQFDSAASRGCSPELLAKFESMIGVRLPGDYREFLLEVNGGKPTGRGADAGKYSILAVDWAGREPQQAAEEVMVDYLLVVEDWEINPWGPGTDTCLFRWGVSGDFDGSFRYLK